MSNRNREKKLAAIRAAWGKPRDQYIPIGSVRIYFDKQSGSEAFQVIDDRIANDLDLDRVFETLDHTNSRVGQQCLYDRLRRPTNRKDQLEKLEDRITFFQEEVAQREEAQLHLQELNEARDYYFPMLIFDQLPKRPGWMNWAFLLQGITVGAIVFTIFYPAAFWVLIAVLPVNLFLHYQNKNRIGKFLVTFNRFSLLYRTGRQLKPYISGESEEIDRHFRTLKNILYKIGWINLEKLQEREEYAPLWFLIEVLKFITLSELILFFKLLDQIKQHRSSIQFIYEAIGAIDTAISIASLRASLPHYTRPEFTASAREISLVAALHPLLLDGVANDLQLRNKSMLLTGSNMSGKTTYIRAMGLNVILAQSIFTPICKSYCAPFFRLGTSIRIQDDVEEDKSYYLEEVNVIGELIKKAGEPQPHLFIVDEMFKGTNTLERVSAAKAVLSHLDRGNSTVLISTHDIELTEYLGDTYDLYYFQESVENDTLTFDYQLKKGKLRHRNAIRILEIMGYPPEVTREAHQLAAKIKIS
ncbi:MutS-related protein [Flavilitoribacter nigricans]|uniref:DNA mismatch repair proteins mutS family domain-containing protein n=1 Tax=Flavilitoribacter nigricans (strain ATCC 23147 / DSM 23189 / NBRC 102662 / NCIMB 1420 / SS-2) TaxID=1122177 RepID=A0A2D0N707_FLAN2|nr:hypothetical protein [Flavilitoribacter nigricans]PHN04178.1 hypothetical protein CRP01_23580 [Flavilitoribacter nigricans DSM 23189 = NBRC 102662]